MKSGAEPAAWISVYDFVHASVLIFFFYSGFLLLLGL